MPMSWIPLKVSRLLFVVVGLLGASSIYAQREQEIRPSEESLYGRRFFVQLRGVFGRFRDSDLQRVFEKAQPIQCSELVNDKGEWRTVAFFNEKRQLGDWYRSNFEEVKSDLAVFVFKGVCRAERGPVQLTTKFPVTESVEAYNRGRIDLEEVVVNVNTAVGASFDVQTQAYTFDLLYLFLVSRQDSENLYSLEPPRLAERARYATDVISHWDCKSVIAEAVTYQFLICRTTTVPRKPAARSRGQAETFGASAYMILSDGKEASSSVKLTFDDANDAKHIVEDASASKTPEISGPATWELPDSDEKLVDLGRDEFRLRFNSKTWSGRMAAPEVLSERKLSSLESSSPPAGANYCVWLPGDASSAGLLLANDPLEPVAYSMTAHDQDGQSSTSIVFDVRSAAGVHLGTLQCVFPRISSAASIAFGRWTSIVGDHLTLEVRP